MVVLFCTKSEKPPRTFRLQPLKPTVLCSTQPTRDAATWQASAAIDVGHPLVEGKGSCLIQAPGGIKH